MSNPRPLDRNYRKSTISQYEWNKCVEACYENDMVYVRDSKNPDGPELAFTPDEWEAFIQGVKRNEFEVPTEASPA